MRSALLLLWTLTAAILLPGCLAFQTKEYHIQLKTDHSGEALLRFTNLRSESDDTLDTSADDFAQLIGSYLNGSQIEKQNPGFQNVRKRLFEQNGVLVGEIEFTFDSLSAIQVFKFDRASPYMYYVGSSLSSEQLLESNGTSGGSWMPVIFWPKDAREFFIKTKAVSEVAYHRSLVDRFRTWEGQREILHKN